MVIEFTSAFWDSHCILIVSWLNHVKSQFSGLRWLTIPRADFCIPYITQHSPCWWSLHYQAWVEEMSIVSPDFLGQTVLSPNLRWWFWWFWWFWAAGIVIWLFLPSFVAGVVPLFGIWWQVGMVGMVVGALMLPISEWLFHHEKMWFSGVNIFFVGEPEYSDILLKRVQIPALRWFDWSGILDVGMQRTPPGFRVNAEFWFVLDQLTFHVFGLFFAWGVQQEKPRFHSKYLLLTFMPIYAAESQFFSSTPHIFADSIEVNSAFW